MYKEGNFINSIIGPGIIVNVYEGDPDKHLPRLEKDYTPILLDVVTTSTILVGFDPVGQTAIPEEDISKYIRLDIISTIFKGDVGKLNAQRR